MGAIYYQVRCLSYFDDTEAFSDMYELEDCVALHFQLAATSIGGGGSDTLQVTPEVSIDGVHWSSVTGSLASLSAAGEDQASITDEANLWRYCRFKYDWAAGTASTATFCVDLFLKFRT